MIQLTAPLMIIPPFVRFYSLKVLVKAKQIDSPIDVVAIHGMGAHPDNTWAHRNKVNWLTDPTMLPAALPNARIMRFGYKSDWFGDASIEAKTTHVHDIAETLLTQLGRLRQESSTPLIFVAHSFGGHVLIQALRRSYENPSLWSNPFRSTAGLVFFGTPFRGRGGIQLEEWVDRLRQKNREQLGFQIWEDSMRLSVQENPYLGHIVRRFQETRRGDYPIPAWCFYETLPSPVGKLIDGSPQKEYLITEESACLDISKSTDRHPLNRHHYNLQKFESAVDEDYKVVRDKIISLASQAIEFLHNRSTTKPKPFLIRFLRDRDFVDRGNLLSQIHERCSQPAGRAALVGLGGVGKSQLAIEYVYRVRDRSPDTLIFWIHGSNAARFEEGYREIADILELAGRDDPKANIFKIVYDWLQRCKEKWLIVLDNVDEADFLVDAREIVQSQPNGSVRRVPQPLKEYLPQSQNGSILITTRSQESALRLLEPSDLIPVDRMDQSDAVKLVRKKLESTGQSDDNDRVELAAALDFMPLAIVQAAAYIFQRGSRCSVRQYLAKFEESDRKKTILLENDGGRHRRDREARNSIVTTWHISFDHIYQVRPSAASLLSLMSFFDRQSIPESLLKNRAENGTEERRSGDRQRNSDEYDRSVDSKSEVDEDEEFEKDLQILRDYSFISFEPNRTFNMHALVQLAMRNWLDANGQLERWKEHSITNLSAEFPTGEYETWSYCRILFPHARSAVMQRPEGERSLKEWASLLYKVARYAWWKGSIDEAVELSENAMMVKKEIFGPEHEETLQSMDMVGLAYNLGGRWKEEERLNVETLEIRQRVLGQDHPSTLTTMANLASIYRIQRCWKEAEELEVRVIEINQKVLGPEHPSTLTSITNLALTFSNQERWKKAEKLQVGVMESSRKVLGQQHPSTLTAMANLASTYRSQRRWKKAEELGVRVMETSQKVLGQEHPDTLTSISHLSSTLWRQKRWKEAEKLDKQVMETRQKVLGPEHPSTLVSMSYLASTYWNQRRPKAAAQLQVRVMEISQRALGQEHPYTLTSMADVARIFKLSNRWEEAGKLEAQIIEIKKKIRDTERKNSVQEWINLVEFMVDRAIARKGLVPCKESVLMMEECVKPVKRMLGPENEYTEMLLEILHEWKMEADEDEYSRYLAEKNFFTSRFP